MTDAIIVLCTCPTLDAARDLARQVVGERLAACVNIVPAVTSVYRWQGQIQEDAEILLVIKTTRARYEVLEQTLRGLHPYELPEVIAVPVDRGSNEYLQWLSASTL